MTTLKLLDRVHMVASGAMGLSHPTDAHTYLIDGGSAWALIDAGSGLGTDRLLANMREAGVPADRIETILLTHSHWDHARGAPALSAALGAATAGHEGLRHELEDNHWSSHLVAKLGYVADGGTLDRPLADGDTVAVGDLELRAVSTPGHTGDSMSYLLDLNGRRIAFTGDTLLGEGSYGASWATTDFGAYRASLATLVEAEIDVLLPGHRLPTLSRGHVGATAALEAMDATWHGMVTQGTSMFPSWWLGRFGNEVDAL